MGQTIVEKVALSHMAEGPGDRPLAAGDFVTIRATDGREFSKQIDYPKGDPRNPLTDEEIEEKFEALAAPIMPAEERQELKEAVWNLESVESITELMRLSRAAALAHA